MKKNYLKPLFQSTIKMFLMNSEDLLKIGGLHVFFSVHFFSLCKSMMTEQVYGNVVIDTTNESTEVINIHVSHVLKLDKFTIGHCGQQKKL